VRTMACLHSSTVEWGLTGALHSWLDIYLKSW